MIDVIRKNSDVRAFLVRHAGPGALILNAGSSRTTLGANCVNLDIQAKAGIHCRADVHHLPFRDDSFDAVVVTAVMQYCREPRKVVAEVARVLKPGGFVYVDAPFLQPYCPDMPDLYRFTRHGLIQLFDAEFNVIECAPSISGGSALAYNLQTAATTPANRYVAHALTLIASLLVLPLSRLSFGHHHAIAGAFYLVGMKPCAALVTSRTG